MVCSVLSQTSEDEADQVGHPGDCHPRWSAATAYLVHAVSWLQVYKQVPSRSRPLSVSTSFSFLPISHTLILSTFSI